jgi:thioredoxin reductase (NADPH)
MPEHTRVLIIGSGPAGLTAAIYSARAQLNPIVIEGEPSSTTDQPGGQLMLTTDVENYPGFPEAVTGPELMASMRAQALRFGADLRVNKVQVLDTMTRPFRAWLTDDDEPSITADTVILATGARSMMMNVPGEERLLSHGLSTCATCDGFFFRGQDIAVIGGGDSAMEEAASRRPSSLQDHARARLGPREDPFRVEHESDRGPRRRTGHRTISARHRH